MSRATRMKLKEFRIMNYVPRPSLRWAIESNIGGNEEIEYEKNIEGNERGSYAICTVSEMNFGYSHPSTPLDYTFSLSTN